MSDYLLGFLNGFSIGVGMTGVYIVILSFFNI